ncbi:91_t:CDS:2, partial [Cetraspora pellucida]
QGEKRQVLRGLGEKRQEFSGQGEKRQVLRGPGEKRQEPGDEPGDEPGEDPGEDPTSGEHGQPCTDDSDCLCPFVCRVRGEDTLKCQLTDTRGKGELCDIGCGENPNAACKEGLQCIPNNDK